MTDYVADLSWKSGAGAIEKLDRLRSTMAVNVLIKKSPNTIFNKNLTRWSRVLPRTPTSFSPTTSVMRLNSIRNGWEGRDQKCVQTFGLENLNERELGCLTSGVRFEFNWLTIRREAVMKLAVPLEVKFSSAWVTASSSRWIPLILRKETQKHDQWS